MPSPVAIQCMKQTIKILIRFEIQMTKFANFFVTRCNKTNITNFCLCIWKHERIIGWNRKLKNEKLVNKCAEFKNWACSNHLWVLIAYIGHLSDQNRAELYDDFILLMFLFLHVTGPWALTTWLLHLHWCDYVCWIYPQSWEKACNWNKLHYM